MNNSNSHHPPASRNSNDDGALRRHQKEQKIEHALDFLAGNIQNLLASNNDLRSKLRTIICMQHVVGVPEEAIDKIEKLAAIVNAVGVSKMKPETLAYICEKTDALARVLRVQILSDVDGVRAWQQNHNGMSMSQIQESLVNNLTIPIEYFDGSIPFGLSSNTSTPPPVASRGQSASQLQQPSNGNVATSRPSSVSTALLLSSGLGTTSNQLNAPLSVNDLMALIDLNNAAIGGLAAANLSAASAAASGSSQNSGASGASIPSTNWNQRNQDQQQQQMPTATTTQGDQLTSHSQLLQPVNVNNFFGPVVSQQSTTVAPQSGPSRPDLGLGLAQLNAPVGWKMFAALTGLDNAATGGGGLGAAVNNPVASGASASQNSGSVQGRNNDGVAANPPLNANVLLAACTGGANNISGALAALNNTATIAASTSQNRGNIAAGNAGASLKSAQQQHPPRHQISQPNQGIIPPAAEGFNFHQQQQQQQQNYLNALFASSALTSASSDVLQRAVNAAAAMPQLLSMQQPDLLQQKPPAQGDKKEKNATKPKPNSAGASATRNGKFNLNNDEFPARFVVAAATAAEEYESSKPSAAARRATQEDEKDVWDNQFYNLCKFIVEKKHPLVPSRYHSNKKLGNWVAEQRSQYKSYQAAKASSLTEDRIAKLNSVGFVWVVRQNNEAAWYARFEELKAYQRDHGDCRVPQRYSRNAQLGTWVHTQRRQYKDHQKGKHSSMTEERIVELESIGFVWDAKEEE